jgi:hypothetical protein
MTDKWQSRPPVREGAPHGEGSNFQTRRNICSWAPVGAQNQDRQTDWLTDRQSQFDFAIDSRDIPCGGGAEHLHRSPASRRRRRKGKSRIWDSKMWSWVPLDSDPRMIALASANSTCKRQTRPLARESAPHEKTRNCLTVTKIWSWAPDGCFIPRHTGWLTVGRNITLTLTWLERHPCEGGVEYLHQDPASRRRRRKEKSHIWDSNIWLRIPRDSDPRMTALARTSSNCKGHACPLARESAPLQNTRNCLTVCMYVCIKEWARNPALAPLSSMIYHCLTVIKIWS